MRRILDKENLYKSVISVLLFAIFGNVECMNQNANENSPDNRERQLIVVPPSSGMMPYQRPKDRRKCRYSDGCVGSYSPPGLMSIDPDFFCIAGMFDIQEVKVSRKETSDTDEDDRDSIRPLNFDFFRRVLLKRNVGSAMESSNNGVTE